MKTPLIGFPKIYDNAPPATGSEWLANFQLMSTKAEQGGITVLLGNRGAGKTRMAYEIAKSAQLPNAIKQSGVNNKEALPAVYRTAMMLFVELRSTYHKQSDVSEFDLMHWYREAALLVIDEIQERGESVFEDQKLTAIVDARYQDGRPTILIANYTRDQFAKSVSPSIVSRIQECGGAVEFSWGSFRNGRRPA